MHLQTTSQHGERLSTNGAYVRPVRRKRRNLEVRTRAHVTRLVFGVKKECVKHCKPTALQVEYQQGRGKGARKRRVTARKEIILSAGNGSGSTPRLRDFPRRVYTRDLTRASLGHWGEVDVALRRRPEPDV